MRTTKLGSLTVRITGGVDGRGEGDGPLVVLMHGFGAPGDDLVPLASMIPLASTVRFAFPEAPHALPPPMGGFGRMWWPIDAERLERAMAEGGTRDMRAEDPPGLVESRERLVETIAALRAELAVPEGGLVVGGFSQGSMLACDLALRTDVALDGLVVLSGTFLVEDEWRAGIARRPGLPVFQSHGTYDPLLSFPIAEALADAFAAGGRRRKWVPFHGGHEIPRPVLRALGEFLTPLLA